MIYIIKITSTTRQPKAIIPAVEFSTDFKYAKQPFTWRKIC